MALDIGGTKIAAALVDSASLQYRGQRATPSSADPEVVWAAAVELIEDVLIAADSVSGAAVSGPGVTGVGISSAGPIHLAAGTISPINIPAWREFPVVDRVSTIIPGVPVRLAGDGVCMALGEHRRGAGRAADFLLGMVVSTGIGGGLVLNGVPHLGRTGNAGHVGHIVVESDGAPCSCGGRGCVETLASGPHMVSWARSHGWAASAGAGAKELAEAAGNGDAIALQAFDRAGQALAAGISSAAATCDLDRVVIGGGVANAGPLLFTPLRSALHTYCGLGFLRDLQVVPATLGGDAGLVGAAALLDSACE